MKLVNDKQNKLKKIINEKLLKDEFLSEKIKKTLKKSKLYFTLSVSFSICTVIYSVYLFFISQLNSFLYFSPIVPSFVFIFILSFLDAINIENIYKEKIKYTHDDFVEISNILSESEMNNFIEHIEKYNTVLDFESYINKNIKLDSSDNNIIKENKRINYISSLYKKEI